MAQTDSTELHQGKQNQTETLQFNDNSSKP
jgi:hypothetical protein